MIKVLYLFQGAGFAGAESYALNLIKKMAVRSDVNSQMATCYDGPLKTNLERESCKVICLHGRNNLRSIRDVIKIVRSEHIDLVHCIDLKATIVGGIASLFFRGRVKTVSTIHGLPEPYADALKQIKYMVALAVYFVLLRYVLDGRICVSNDLKKRIETVIGTRKTTVIHNGIEPGTDTPCRPSSIFTIGTVGRLETVKGHCYFLEAARMILAERDDVVFEIIGSGPLLDSLKTTARTLGISERVNFRGFRPDARSLIAAMDIFVLPSLHEGIPYVLLEAMSFSKPVVCSAVGGVGEIVTHNLDGILVSPRDPSELYLSLRTLLLNRGVMESLGKNACNRIKNSFSSSVMAENTYAFYRLVLDS